MDGTTTAEPLSALDAAFLFFERPDEPLVVGALVEVESAADPTLLLSRLEALVEREPRFRQRPVRVALGVERPTWEDDPDFAFIRHYRTAPWPAPGDTARLREVVDTVLARALPTDRPPWEIVSIPGGSEGRAALLLRAHHCLLDGMTGMRMIDLLCDEPEENRSKPRRRNRSTTFDRQSAAGDWARGAFHASAASAPVWDHMRNLAELTSTFVSLLHDDPAPPTSINGRVGRRRHATWACFDRDAYGPVCAETGTTVNEIALSVIAGALRRYFWRHDRTGTRTPLRTLVPVSLRGHADDPRLGNAISALFPHLPVDVADPLERLEQISLEIQELRSRGQPRAAAYALGMLDSLPSMIEAALPLVLPPAPIVNTVCTRVRGASTARRLAGGRILDVHGIVPLFHGMGIQFAILTHAGRLSICAQLDPDLIPNGDEIAGDLEHAFAQLCRAEKRTRRHRREIARLGALVRPVSRFETSGEKPTRPSAAPQRRRRRGP